MRVNACVAFGVTAFAAEIVMLKIPPEVGVPASLAVPSWLSVNVTPAGRAPDSEIAALGNPALVMVIDPDEPIVKLALLRLVRTGAWLTVSVKLWVAFGELPFCAVKATV